MRKLLVLDGIEVTEQFSMKDCISVMEQVLADLETGKCVQSVRTVVPLPGGNVMGFMPAYITGEYFGAKILSVYPQNSQEGYPSHQGQVLLFEMKHGEIVAAMDANSITRIRTGAVSAVAGKYLARPDSHKLAILGTGEQALAHLESHLCLFPITEVTVWGRTSSKAQEFAEKNQTKYDIPIRACISAQEAVEDADIICTVTSAHEPVLKGKWIRPGTHVNLVGACAAANREADSDTIAKARLFCDSRASVNKESGDYLIPLKEGVITEDHLLGTIGDLILGRAKGRISQTDITVFDALGVAGEDIASAAFLYQKIMAH